MQADNAWRERAHYWATANVFSPEVRAEVKHLIDSDNTEELQARFQHQLSFGTGGMRALVGIGTSRLNVYNIRRASHAVSQYLLQQEQAPRVAISYDSRLHSRMFAEASCEVFAAQGIRCFLTKELRPVPILSFMVRHLHCHAGICITASHNPPAYNGYKVYWQHGGQVVPPHDIRIMQLYNSIGGYAEIPSCSFAQVTATGMVEYVGEEIDNDYLATLAPLARGVLPDIRAVYTPLHGAGATIVPKALHLLGYRNVQIVQEQLPDGNFPTVSSPNPEDPQALQMAKQLAEKTNAELLMASDPDCDRLGMMVKTSAGYKHLEGNQMLCVLLEKTLAMLQAEGKLKPNDFVVRTIVTTSMVDAIASNYQLQCQTTLPGFKWIGHLLEEYESGARTPYRRFIFGGEDSYGMLYGRELRDKDGIIASCLAMKISCQLHAEGKTWHEALDEMYQRYGVYQHKVLSLPLASQLLPALRAKPTALGALQRLDDYQQGVSCLYRDNVCVAKNKLKLPPSDILQLQLTDESLITVRPSGTEAVLKCYLAVRAQGGNNLQANKDKCLERLHTLMQQVKTYPAS